MLTLTFIIHGRTKEFNGSDLASLSRAWGDHRDAMPYGSSAVTGGDITDGGKFVGRMSYNGKVWAKKAWKDGDKPIYG